MSVDEAFNYIFTWHSLSDACPECQSLNGKEWLDQDLFADFLWDPIYGSLWDLNADRSLMHGGSGTCRCQLEVRVEMDLSKVEEFKVFEQTLGEFAY